MRGLCFYYQDNVDKAFSHFQHVLRMAPDHAKARDIYRVPVDLFPRLFSTFPPGFIGSHRVYRVLPSFTGFYRVLPGFTGFYSVLLGFTGYIPSFLHFY